MVKFVRKKQGL